MSGAVVKVAEREINDFGYRVGGVRVQELIQLAKDNKGANKPANNKHLNRKNEAH